MNPSQEKMLENTEEKKKCLEKLNQMQKYLPFLDFMIDKIKKKNSEVSLECQLSKFQLLRSMIAEKKGKYTWNVVVKVEDVIQKLISKLDFKDPHEKSKEALAETDNHIFETSMATSISIVPSSPTAVTMAATSAATSSRTTTVDSKPEDTSTNAVNFIMKTLKISVDSNKIKNTNSDNELLLNASGCLRPAEVSEKLMETDLDKDLDGFDLTDCPSLTGAESGNTVVEKVSSQDDLLSSSREKLLKSLQSRLFPSGIPTPPAPPSAFNRNEKGSELSSSAFGRSHVSYDEYKILSDVADTCEFSGGENRKRSQDVTIIPLEKKSSVVVPKLVKPGSLPDKVRTEPVNTLTSDVSLKQKLKEKLSTDICEVYRVPGKSVGGSLRSLKESKDHKKCSTLEEEELFKPDKTFEKVLPNRSRLSTEKKDNLGDKSHRESTHSTGEKKGSKNGDQSLPKQESSGSGNKVLDDRGLKSTQKEVRRSERGSSKEEKQLLSKKPGEKPFDVNRSSEHNLLRFVKEKIQSFPQLASTEWTELKQAVQSSSVSKVEESDADTTGEKSGGNVHDAENPITSGEQTPKQLKWDCKEKSDSKETKEEQVGSDEIKPTEPKKDNFGDDVSVIENVGDENYSLKLIDEDTTPKTYSRKYKKKGLLELPMPITDGLLDDISVIESFESFRSPVEGNMLHGKRNKSVEKSESNSESSKSTKEIPLGVTSVWVNPLLSKDPNYCSKFSTEKLRRCSQENVNNKLQDFSAFESVDVMFRNPCFYVQPSPYVTDLRHNSLSISESSSEAKSYAEYKRRKLKEQEKTLKESFQSTSSDSLNGSEFSRSPAEKEETTKGAGKNVRWDSFSKPSPPKSFNTVRTYENRKSGSYSKRDPPRRDFRDRRSHEEDTRKDDKAKKIAESEELVSPLEELYGNERRPKTGRGYGIQNFKIPKKVVRGSSLPKKNAGKSDAKTSEFDFTKEAKESFNGSNVRENEKEKEVTESSKLEESRKTPERCDVSQVDSTAPCKSGEKVDIIKTCSKTETSVTAIESKNCSKLVGSDNSTNTKGKNETNPEVESITVPTPIDPYPVSEVESKIGSTIDKTDVQRIPKPVMELVQEVVTIKESKTVKKFEAQVAECDSSIEMSTPSELIPGKDCASLASKSGVVSKDEITQEFVEALIRKSFQSGEGKLLLAQVKLFEKFAKKLNSKKLKTIQRIINSESDSSSPSDETSSEDEKKRKKVKKSDAKSPKMKKRKKKGRNKRKKKASITSSSSSLENEGKSDWEEVEVEEDEEEEEDYCDKREGGDENRKSESRASSEAGDCEEGKPLEKARTLANDEPKTKINKRTGVLNTKCKRRRKNSEFGRNFSGRKVKRKQGQKNLLEQILNEEPQPKSRNDSESKNSCEAPTSSESKRKGKRKAKGKGKTELDRLHEDIRSMFISAGVVTATGQRMCRILKQSGGNMNNLDIVKESAKMVEEEKLKKARTRTSVKNPRVSKAGSRSRSHSLEGGRTREVVEESSKLALEPCVTLQRVDLDNLGYAIKLSEDCVSFRRLRARNMAIRKTGMFKAGRSSKNYLNRRSVQTVFLARNKRKFERLRDSNRKKSYTGKKLIDVVRNLPLKMARMKHLQISENNEGNLAIRQKKIGGKKSKTKQAKNMEMNNSQLLKYAFDKKREIYPCKLCTAVTRNITGHYKMFHPDKEVLISRLNIQEAKRAKLDTEKHGYGRAIEEKQSPLAVLMKRRLKALLRRGITYNCRMCPNNKIDDLNTFASHVSSHTGEFRYKCPSQDCNVHRFSHEDMRFHILTKHPKYRNELTDKIKELYELTVYEKVMLGYLCSECHFVQICRSNLENHISNQHGNSDNVYIITINMSGRKTRPNKRTLLSNDAMKESSSFETASKSLTLEGNTETPPSPKTNADEGKKINKRKRKLEGEPEAKKSETIEEPAEKKKLLSSDSAESVEEGKRSGEVSEEDEIDVEKGGNTEEVDNVENIMEAEDEDDLKNGTDEKEDDSNEGLKLSGRRSSNAESEKDVVGSSKRLKVGPLEAQLLENSGVLYECYVKGCLFSTRVYDLFQKHIMISHWKTKWNGICDFCSSEKESEPRGELKLLNALKHLKLHEWEKRNQEKEPEDVDIELKCFNSSENSVTDDEDLEKLKTKTIDEANVKEGSESLMEMDNSSEASYPPKPLLRVRNFLGDRLSTPKPEENLLETNDEDSSASETSANPENIFTIENVRSLVEAPAEESGIKIEQVCSLKDKIPKQGSQNCSGKTIIVRSCPTRKIAIRPEPSAVPVDVGHINVVQPPLGPSHPVVLSPISNSAPIRIISTTLSTKPISVKPIMVSTDPVRLSGPSAMPVICSSMSPPCLSPAISPVTDPGAILPVAETKSVSLRSPPVEGSSGGAQSKNSLGVERMTSPTRSKSPGPVPGILQMGKNSPDAEEAEKNSVTNQRMPSNPGTGKKSVKDAKIYQEMLTKTKLCHLFKCMGIECSFTCNNVNVFAQHIGLHEAQRRLERSKGIRTFRMTNRAAEAFYWQQCAYCCEVVSNINKALSHHILEEHGHCMYQCAFCFYRAICHNYVEIHQNFAHGEILKTTPRLIYKCKPLKSVPSEKATLEKHRRRQSVRPYHCDQCGQKFFITQEFTRHLASEHQSVTAYTCHICKNLCFKVNRLINHYKLHSYSMYQCAYCLHGTETEKEMVFHLSNFHFSQPPIMYERVLAEGQSDDKRQKPKKKKKQQSNQLDSLKVIVYESDASSSNCVEVEPEEEVTDNSSATAVDLSAIAAELGITTDPESSSSSSSGVTPLMQELASIGDKAAKNLTVKTLLPNAQFSSENESGIENCSVLISSGLSIPSDQNDEKEMSIPLGQLPLEAVNVQHKEATSPVATSPPNVSPLDKNLKLNEIIVNLQQKDKSWVVTPTPSEDEKRSGAHSSAVHKLPPVVTARGPALKSYYPAKAVVCRKKSGEQMQGETLDLGDKELGANQKSDKEKTTTGERIQLNECSVENESPPSRKCSIEKDVDSGGMKTTEPLITNVVSLSSNEFDKEEPPETDQSPILISNVCSLYEKSEEAKESSKGVVVNIKTKTNCSSVLKPPIIRVEDFPIDENPIPLPKTCSRFNENAHKVENPVEDPKSEKKKDTKRVSPDVIILEQQKAKGIVTVILDSDEEKDERLKKVKEKKREEEEELNRAKELIGKDDKIRKEMELLRKQITNETDSLLHDEPETNKPMRKLSLDVRPEGEEPSPCDKTLLSPIEEAICSLNKKLQSETEEAQKKEEKDEKKEKDESSRKSRGGIREGDGDGKESGNKVSERPRTRYGARERRKESSGEGSEKTEGGDESGCKKDDSTKAKKFKEDLVGKELFICGNEKCDFATDDDISLKDHLYVCDLSRESSVLVCPHCSRQIKQFHPYLEHLKYHGEKKFHCGLCSFTSAVDTSTSRHVKQKHKCSLIKILPKDSKEGHLVYYPKNYKVDKIDFEVNGYSPGDEDKLPLQSVYQVNVKCAKCPYFTKVRSNMVRHLKIHVKSVETEGVVVVPSTAPTNPVPCLETKERMFDKMTNLAASSQLAQAKEKTSVESLSPEEEAKLPQFVVEQMRYKCCLPDCNYITVDDGMLKHHIKALHDEINHYSCPHCKDTVHADVRHVVLDKIGYHLKHHDAKLYKCAYCIYFHYQKNVVEKHTLEKHPDKRYYVHTVREPKREFSPEEESSGSNDGGARMWKCGMCDEFKTPSKPILMDHLLKTHNTKSKYKCQFCSVKGNSYQAFANHFSSKHAGEKVSYVRVYHSEKVAGLESQSGNSSGADSSNEHFDTTPLWQRGAPRIRHIRGILIEEEEIKTKRSRKISVDESEGETSDGGGNGNENAFYCPLCTTKKKPYFTRSEDCFRSHLYQELNYQQYACILCGKMFVDRKDFDKHHTRVHPDKPQALKQTKEDHEIKFWVDQVIAKRKKQMEERKRKLSDTESSECQGPLKKKKEV